MKNILVALMAIGALTSVPAVAVAVDKTISPLCRADSDPIYSRPGGFCEHVAAYATKSVYGSGGWTPPKKDCEEADL
jgi:hypothetical protein